MEDLKYFISESQRFRTAADYVEEEAMISRRGSPRAAPAAGPHFHGGGTPTQSYRWASRI